MTEILGLSRIVELTQRSFSGSAETIAAVTDLAQRLSGIDVTVVSEITAEGDYVFRGLEARAPIPIGRDDRIPYAWSLCSRIHAAESPAAVPDTRAVPALWQQWLRLKEGLGVDWDVRAFCTRDIVLPDGTRFGTICFHHWEPRGFSPDEQAILDVLGRLLAQEIWRERASGELREAAAALERAERERYELAEELRHELRAPLQVIDGYGEAMLDGILDRSSDHLALVRGEATRAMRLLDDIIELTRLETGVETARPEPVDLSATAQEMCARLAPLADASGVVLAVEGEPVEVIADPRRIEQLVVNLVRNAVRATAEGGGSRVDVTVDHEEGEAVLTVVDDGPGLGEGELTRVFERFYRGGSARDARTGSGLGLTIVRRIVTALGGEVSAASAVGGGARFAVRLPALPESRADSAEAAVEP